MEKQTITMFSNFLNHHQIPFCNEMYKLLDGNFTFVATEPVPEERKNLGYLDDFSKFPYLLKSYESEEHHKKALKLGLESDVVITGSAPDIYIKERIKANKLTFRYSERVLKEGWIRLLDPRVWFWRFIKDTRLRNKNVHLLCASAYAASDYKWYFAYPNKMYQWGYFPENYKYDETLWERKRQNEKVEFVWVGRFLDWKRPLMAVKLIHKIKDEFPNIHLTMIGIGPEFEKVEKYIKKFQLESFITLTGSMSPTDVRKHMEQANIFITTSNRKEGWGAVLNEGMNSGCACLSSYLVGAAPFLIKQNVNGIMFDDLNDLITKTKNLLSDTSRLEKLGKKAYETIDQVWNAKTAAKQLKVLIFNLILTEKQIIEKGPCKNIRLLREKKVKNAS
ncbi:MAG TPA: glycosyltransferase [Bacilli bacterium]|nr:glycosyltransferase [Bacilli bacterium]